MEKKTKIIIGVVIAIIAIVLVGLFIIGSGEVTLQAEDLAIKLPNNYTVDNNAVASAGDVNISFAPQLGVDKKFEEKFFGAIKDNGKAAGYENITNKTINGIPSFEFAAHPDKLQNVSSNREYTSEGETWTTYPPEAVSYFQNPVDHFRTVDFLKDDKVYTLQIFTNNPNTNLYTPEIEAIINSVAPVSK
jgi:hypothetical protein